MSPAELLIEEIKKPRLKENAHNKDKRKAIDSDKDITVILR